MRRLLLLHIIMRLSLTIMADTSIMLGAVLSDYQNVDYFNNAISKLQSPPGYAYSNVSILIDRNPLVAAKDICDQLLPQRTVAVIYEVPPDTENYMVAVPYTLEFYKISVLGVSTRSSVLSNQYTHPQFMRTLPAYSYEAALWFDTLRFFRYNKVLFVYTNDAEGQAALSKFRDTTLETEIPYGEPPLEIAKLIVIESYERNLTRVMAPMLEQDARVVILAAGKDEARRVFQAASELGVGGASWVWIITERAAAAPNVPQGALSWRVARSVLAIQNNIQDALDVINAGLTQFLQTHPSLGEIPSSCHAEVRKHPDEVDSDWGWDLELPWWQEGVDLYELMKDVKIPYGRTGSIEFNEEGDRKSVNFDLINYGENSTPNVVGMFISEYNTTIEQTMRNMKIYPEKILWPGQQETRPIGINVSNHLRVVTIAETPFVYTEEYDPVKGCNDTQLTASYAKMRCPKHLDNGTVLEFCCYGYLIDMMDMMAVNMSVTFGLQLVHDDEYGTMQQSSNTTGKAEWNGMMGELLSNKADMIVAPFTINPERSKFVDFTKPFKFLGMTILVKKTTKKSNLDSFTHPFQKTLWYLVIVSVFVIALVLYLLDRFSPFGQLQLARDSESEDALTLSTAIWFSWGVLLNSGIGEGTPKSFSARVLGMIWAGFAMIIVASYTANLAAFLVLDRPEASISGIDDPRLRNPTDSFKFATVKGSSIEEYFKRQVEFTTMYRTMEPQNKKTVEEAIKAVEDGEIHAFIWDSPRLIYEAAQKCGLMTAGELFGRSSYGIAFEKNSPWTEKFSLKLLSYHEVGRMESYDNKWIMQEATACDDDQSSPATLGLTNMAGVFMMVTGGIGIGFMILLVEIGYNKYEMMKEKQNSIAKKVVCRWQRYVQRRKALRKTWALIKTVNDSNDLNETEHRSRLRDYLSRGNQDSLMVIPGTSTPAHHHHENGEKLEAPEWEDYTSIPHPASVKERPKMNPMYSDEADENNSLSQV